MRSVTGIDRGRAHCLRGIFRCSLRLGAHDNRVYAHGFNRLQRIAQALALYDAARACIDIHYIRTEIFPCQFKGGTRTRARFIKKSYDGFPRRVGTFLMSRWMTFFISLAVSSTRLISSGEKTSRSRMFLPRNDTLFFPNSITP